MGSPEKKVVLRLDLHDDKAKQKAMKAVSTVSGIDSITMDMKERKMTVIGLADPVVVVSKLRKTWRTEIISIGPAKEPKKEEEKKEEPKKEEPKKEEEKKEEAKKEEPEAKKEEPKKEAEPKQEEAKKEEPKKEEAKKEEPAKKEAAPEQMAELIKLPRPYYPPYMMNTQYPYMNAYPYVNAHPYVNTRYAVHSVEEDPNSCVIC